MTKEENQELYCKKKVCIKNKRIKSNLQLSYVCVWDSKETLDKLI